MLSISGDLGLKVYNAFFFFFFNSHVLCKLGVRFSALSHFKI